MGAVDPSPVVAVVLAVVGDAIGETPFLSSANLPGQSLPSKHLESYLLASL